MRRADRLFQIVQYLRSRRLTTAAQLAEWLEVSERTVYRDIQDLAGSGVPVSGEAGVGYRLARTFDLPPIMFTFDEVEALVAGARMIAAWGGPALAAGSRSAIAKITLALPPGRRESVEETKLFATNFHLDALHGESLEAFRQGIVLRRKIRMHYGGGSEAGKLRTVWPLGLHYWGAKWTLAAWCELRHDYRTFRVDRASQVELLGDGFPKTEEFTLEGYLAVVTARSRSDFP